MIAVDVATKQTLLVELDVLLDTRLATLARIDPALAARAAETQYLTRLSDDFDALFGEPVNERFKELYAKRDRETLMISRVTSAVFIINELLNGWELMSIHSPHVEEASVEINTYPYELSSEETDAIVTAVTAYAPPSTPVKVVRYSPEELTPGLIKNRWTVIMLYDFNGWLEIHQEAIKTTKIPQVLMVTPALFHKPIPTEEELEREGLAGINPFAALEVVLAEHVGLKLIDVKYFSIATV